MATTYQIRNNSRSHPLSFRAYCLACSALIALPVVPAMAQEVAEEEGAKKN